MKYVTHAELEAAIAGAARGIALGVREAMGSKPAAAQALRAKRLAFAVTDILKFAGSGKRVLRGLASTGTVDAVGDILEPMGAEWKTPLPLLHQHRHDRVIGAVRKVAASAKGIEVEAEIADGIGYADEVWQLVQMGALDAFSVGFSPIKWQPLAGGGIHYTKWRLNELSVVAVPCNRDARITGAAEGKSTGAVKLIQPGVKLIQPVKLIGGQR